MTTEALVFLGELDPDAIGPSLEHATHYEPTPVAQAEALLDASPLAPARATFVDLGAGMGRVVLLAARRPYRTVIGVEISPALVEIARENVAAARAKERAGEMRSRRGAAGGTRDVRIVLSDAAEYAFPPGDLVVYLYNPFRAPVLERVLAALAAPPARDVVLLYHTPVERDAVDAGGAFEQVADLGFGLVYRRRASDFAGPGYADGMAAENGNEGVNTTMAGVDQEARADEPVPSLGDALAARADSGESGGSTTSTGAVADGDVSGGPRLADSARPEIPSQG